MNTTFFTTKQPVVSTLSTRRWYHIVLMPFLGTRVLLLFVGYLVSIFLAPHFAGAAFLPQHSGFLATSWQMWRWFD